jgi:hypothetical protein
MSHSLTTPSLDRWTDAQAEQYDDGCQCVHLPEGDDDAPIAHEPSLERYAEAIAQRG